MAVQLKRPTKWLCPALPWPEQILGRSCQDIFWQTLIGPFCKDPTPNKNLRTTFFVWPPLIHRVGSALYMYIDHVWSCNIMYASKKINDRTDLCKRAYLSLVQLPWWGCAPHFVATNWWCTAKVLQNIQNAIPRRHAYYKMTDTAAQKTPWSACWTFLTHRGVTRNRTFSTSTKPKNCVFLCFFFLAFGSKLWGTIW